MSTLVRFVEACRSQIWELKEAEMERSGCDELLAFLFDKDGRKLVNLKLFRGSDDLVTHDELAAQLHSAYLQKQMGKAIVSEWLPESPRKINVHEFVAGL